MAISSIRRGFEIKTATTNTVTIAAGANGWLTVPNPTGYKSLGVIGYYLRGTGATMGNVYAVTTDNGVSQIAIRNTWTADEQVYADVILMVYKT